MNPDEAISQLPEIRRDRGQWSQFAYLPSKDADGIEVDNNWRSRYALIIALQYNWTSSDEELLRFILKHETLWHRKRPGLSDSLHRSSHLLAKFRNPANVFLFYEAKEANFDTYSGYHSECIFSAGIRETIDFLNASDNPKRLPILGRVEGEIVDGYIDETQLQLWLEDYARVFPATVEEEDRETLIDRAIIFGDIETGRALIGEWYRSIDSSLYNLSRDAKSLGEYGLAIMAQKKIRLSHTSSRDLVSNSQEIAEIHRLAGSLDEAWEELKSCEPDLERFDSWKTTGLGRFVIDTALRISLDSENENPIKEESFYWAHDLIGASENITLVIFQAAFEAAVALHDERLQKHYETLRDQEQRRIDDTLKCLRPNDSEEKQ